MSDIFTSFFYFYAYSLLRKLVIRQKGLPASKAILRPGEEIGIGFAAGVISRAISTPLSLVTVRLQAEKQNGDSEEDASVSTVVKQIYEDHGLRGFWKGALPLVAYMRILTGGDDDILQASRQRLCFA